MKEFEKSKWEKILGEKFQFSDVEITFYEHETYDDTWYGTFTTYSRIIEGVQHDYFFNILNDKHITYKKIH